MCDFTEAHMCNIRNQPSMPMNFTALPEQTLSGRRGIYLLSVTPTCNTGSGARLYTPYFMLPPEWPSCLQLSYWAFGNALHSMSIYQQDEEGGRRIWHKLDFQTQDCWTHALIDLSQPRRRIATRFFIEAKLMPASSSRAGFIALSQLSIVSRYCSQ